MTKSQCYAEIAQKQREIADYNAKIQLLFHLCTMAADNPDPADTFLSMPSDYQSLQQSVAGHGTRLLYRQQKNLPQTVPVFLFVLPSLFAAI